MFRFASPLFRPVPTRVFLQLLCGVLLTDTLRAVELPVLKDSTVTQGTPVQGDPAVRERMSEISARDKLFETAAHARHSFVFRRMPPPSAATEINTPAAAPAASSVQTLNSNLNFTAATFNDCSGWPPDTMGAVGPTQFITALNGRVRSFNKTNGLKDNAIDVNTDVFFQSVMTPPTSSNFTTDPRIRYDRLSGRWFIIMIDVPGQKGTQPNRVMIAMSDSGTITSSTVWTFFEFAGDASNFADYPTLGIDANALYIGANIFSTSGSGSFVNTSAFVVRKTSLLSGGPIVYTPFSGLITVSGRFPHQTQVGPYTPQGVDNFDPTAAEGYFIGTDVSSLSTLQLLRVSNPGGTPSLSGNISIGVNPFASPINVTVSGTSGTVDGLDVRLLAAHYRNGCLWTSHNVGVNSSGGTSSPNRNGSCWYQITNIPTGQTPSVVQSGTVYIGSSNVSCWMGTVMVSGQGHAAMGCTVAGPNTFLNAAWMGRLAGDPVGAMSVPTLYTASSSAYNPSDGASPHRWGDYSFTSLDPSDDMTMWTIQEWCQSAGNGFAVQAAQLLAPPPATPVSCNPTAIGAGASNVNVVVTGQVINGSGFFDPGAAFPRHIAAAAGDVIVNSVTYNNPTTLTLNVSVTPTATAGARLISVTNPDGQSVTSGTGILTVTNAALPPPPVVNFSATPTNGVAPLAVTFTNTSIGATSYSWNFGDGGSSVSADPSHTYTNAGDYTVTLTAIGAGGTNTLSRANYIVDTNPLPSVAFVADPTHGGAPLTVYFTNQSSGATNYSWSFGDGHTNKSANPTNTYESAGNYNVSLTASGPGGEATLVLSNYIVLSNSPPTLAPIANRIVHPGMVVTVTNSATDPDLGQTLSYSLDPGAPPAASIDPASGIFTWTPDNTYANNTNSITVRVTDNGVPPLSEAQSFTVSVIPLTFQPVSLSNGVLTISWGSISGVTYRVQYATNLGGTNWSDLPPDITATGNTASTTDTAQPDAQRFYRVFVLP